ncbi:MAG: class I adenylate-forming enzyme family protein [Pseudomonadota bacterium]
MSASNPILEFCEQTVAAAPEFAVGTKVVDGIEYPVFKNAPPSLHHLYAHAAATYADLDFLVYHDERLTFAETETRSLKLASALLAHGVEPGQPVAIAMRNFPEWVIAYMAITRIGAVAVLMNAWWKTAELAYACEDSGAKLVFADQQRAERMGPIRESHGLQIVVARGSADGATDWDAFIGGADASPSITPPSADDVGTIFYTSGSTGNPKGVLQTHQASINTIMCWALLSTADRMVRGKGPAEGRQMGILLAVPLFHVTGCNALFLLSVLAGQKLVMIDRWDVEHALECIEKEHLTAFNGVPSMSFELAEAAKTSDRDLSSLYAVSGGGAARPAAHVPLIDEAIEHVMPSVGYGMTETSALGTANAGAPYQDKPNSVGAGCFPLVTLRIVREDGSECETGEAGEIWIRSIANMKGYLNQPEATAETLQDGYVKSGDVGYVDEDGDLFIVDRLKDIVIRGGENISCQEVEDALYAHPQVKEAAAFGLPCEKLGEQLVAVVFAADPAPDQEALQAFVKDRLAYYKVPVSIEVRNEPLPRGATAKIYKRGLREAALAAM